jgi:hypothetical protein
MPGSFVFIRVIRGKAFEGYQFSMGKLKIGVQSGEGEFRAVEQRGYFLWDKNPAAGGVGC